MACDSLSSDTAMSIECESSSTSMGVTSAGAMALITNCALLSIYGMMSTRSPAISLDTACTREPRMPTHAPTGSMRGSLLRTGIFAITRGAENLDQALPDLRHLELEELDEELRRRASEEQLRAARLGAHLLEVG